MIKKIFHSKFISLALLCALSFVSGGINGFLGTGGGIILIYMLQLLTENNKKDNFASTLCATIPMSLIALFSYIKNQNVDFPLIKRVMVPAALGGLLGAFLTDKLKIGWVSAIFAALVIYSGFCLVLR